MNKAAVILGCGLVLAGLTGPLFAEPNRVVLVTAEEGKLPQAPKGELTFRAGISRGPTITLMSPKPADKNVQSPVHLELKFEGRGGAQIDVDTLKLTYVKSPSVDLTDRIKTYAKPVGLDVPVAELPPGAHTIRAEIKDKDGRIGFIIFNLDVAN